jgi:hypothetical protein
MDWVLGILKCTTSPNSATFDIGCLPRIFCIAVLPSGLTRHREIRHAACLISQSTIWAFMWILADILSSSADLSVRIWASTSWIALSTLALVFDSPTADASMEVP